MHNATFAKAHIIVFVNKFMKAIKSITFFLAAALLFSLVAISYYVLSVDYDTFINKLGSLLQKPNLIDILKARMSIDKLQFIKKVVIALNVAAIIGFYFFWRTYKRINHFLYTSVYECRVRLLQEWRGLRQLSAFEKIFLTTLFSLVFVKALYTNFYQCLWYDEMWTYNYFLSGPLWKAVFFPGNNHKIYTTIAWFFVQLPFDTKFLMRLPNMLTGLVTIFSFYVLVKNRFSKNVVYIGLAWFAFCYLIDTFQVIARSYIYVALFTIIYLYEFLNIVENKFNRSSLLLVTIATILGYWGNYVFFFGHFCITIAVTTFAILPKRHYILKSIVGTQTIAFLAILLIALPDFFSGHVSAVLGHSNFVMTSDPPFIQSLEKNAWFTLGFKRLQVVYMLIPIAAIAIAYAKKFSTETKLLSITSAFAMYFILIWDTLRATLTTHHIVIFLTVFVAIEIMIVLQGLSRINRVSKSALTIASILIFILSTYGQFSNDWFNWGKQYDPDNKFMAEAFLKQNAKKLYIGYNYFKPAAEFYANINNRQFIINMQDSSSVDYKPFNPLKETYEGIVQNNKKPLPVDSGKYKVLLKREEYTAFIRR